MNQLVAILNGLSINDGTNGLSLTGEISGLSLPDIRTTSGLFSGQDGGFVGPQFYGFRYITLQGRAIATDATGIYDLRRQLQAALATFDAPVQIITYDGKSYLIYAKVTKFDMPINNFINMAAFKIELLAADPIIYDNTAGTDLVATLSKVIAGGFTWPITWPLVWPTASGPTPIMNSGTVFVKPKITLTDIMTNPIITNVTTGQVFAFTGLTTSAGDVVVIDMRARTVTLNGGSILQKVTTTSEWWGLQIGSNDIKLETSSGTDTVTGTISWRNGVLGI